MKNKMISAIFIFSSLITGCSINDEHDFEYLSATNNAVTLAKFDKYPSNNQINLNGNGFLKSKNFVHSSNNVDADISEYNINVPRIRNYVTCDNGNIVLHNIANPTSIIAYTEKDKKPLNGIFYGFKPGEKILAQFSMDNKSAKAFIEVVNERIAVLPKREVMKLPFDFSLKPIKQTDNEVTYKKLVVTLLNSRTGKPLYTVLGDYVIDMSLAKDKRTYNAIVSSKHYKTTLEYFPFQFEQLIRRASFICGKANSKFFNHGAINRTDPDKMIF